jgi:hypothetical protein
MIDTSLIVEIRTAPIKLDDSSELYTELALFAEEDIRYLLANRISAEEIAVRSSLLTVLSSSLTKQVGAKLEVMAIYQHDNVRALARSIMLCIKVDQKTIDDYTSRGVPSFEDVFKDFK